MTFSPSQIFSYWARMRPEATAIVCEDQRIGWADYSRAVHSVAVGIQRCGVRPGDRVGLLLPNSAEWAIIYGAIWVAGGIIVPLNHRFGSFELRGIEEDAECSLLITTPLYGGSLGDRFELGDHAEDEIILAPRNCGEAVPASYALLAGQGLQPDPFAFDPAAVAAIFYTSGTTGRPKGTMHSHAAIQAGVYAHAASWNMTGEDRTLIVAPLAFTGVSLCLLTPVLLMGGCSVIERDYEPERMLRLLEQEHITFLSGVPTIWDRLPKVPGFAEADLSALVNPQTGGAPVPRSLLELYRQRNIVIRQTYGSTEAGGFVTFPTMAQALETPESAGSPVLGLEVRVVDQDGQDCPLGVAGEIWVRGPQVMSGYWRNPEATKAAMSDGWYKSGDMGALDDQGALTIMDRLKNMIISGGVNIYPAEIERAMASIAGVDEIGVFGMADEAWGECAVALIHGCALFDLDRIRAEARALLGPLKTPRTMLISPEPLPRTVTGKVARQHLPDLHARLTQNFL